MEEVTLLFPTFGFRKAENYSQEICFHKCHAHQSNPLDTQQISVGGRAVCAIKNNEPARQSVYPSAK